ncbi:hypothetical protein EDC01DRAFT_634269 [Geopyxis carbonaria]|nr:hypothetical protein EDC01DRAFT_634269 [Geopyxis carbonaria]
MPSPPPLFFVDLDGEQETDEEGEISDRPLFLPGDSSDEAPAPVRAPALVPLDISDSDDELMYMGTAPVVKPAPVTPVQSGRRSGSGSGSGSGVVDLDNLLEMIDRSTSKAPSPQPMASSSLQRRPRRGAPAQVLGKRNHDDDDKEVVMSTSLLDEVALVNNLFKSTCLDFEAPPAQFRLSVAGSRKLQVLLNFSSGYPIELPEVLQVPESGGEPLAVIAKNITLGLHDNKPCLERLMRALAEALAQELGHVSWRFKPQPPTVKNQHMLTLADFQKKMEDIRSHNLDYPPKMPEFERKDGWNTAFYMEGFARSLLATTGVQIEGNERLEFLGDSVANAMISITMMKKYQLNETGMSYLHCILRCNKLFSVFSTAYNLPARAEELQAQHNMPTKITDPKKQADIFEAAIGGLYEDGAETPGGWITLQTWFDALIEPWVDWLFGMLHPDHRARFTTFNKMCLDDDSGASRRSRLPLPPRGAPWRGRRKVTPTPRSPKMHRERRVSQDRRRSRGEPANPVLGL